MLNLLRRLFLIKRPSLDEMFVRRELKDDDPGAVLYGLDQELLERRHGTKALVTPDNIRSFFSEEYKPAADKYDPGTLFNAVADQLRDGAPLIFTGSRVRFEAVLIDDHALELTIKAHRPDRRR